MTLVIFLALVFSTADDVEAELMQLDRYVERYPEDSKVLYERGHLLLRHFRLDEALRDGNLAVGRFPKDVHAWLLRASAHFARERFDDALADADQAIQLDPENAWAYCIRGFARLALGSRQPAFDDFEKAIALDNQYFRRPETFLEISPDESVVKHMLRVLAYEADMSPAVVVAVHERFAVWGVERRESLYRLALGLEGIGRERDTKQIMRQLAPIRGEPGHIDAHLWLADHILRQRRQTYSDRREAMDRLELVLAERPGDVVANAWRAQVLATSGKPDEAIADLRGRAQKHPELGLILAQTLRGLNRIVESDLALDTFESHFRKIIEAEPTNIQAHVRVTQAEALRQRYAAAAERLRTALDGEPDEPELLKSTLADLYRTWLLDEQNGPPEVLLPRIQTALQYAENDLPLHILLCRKSQGNSPIQQAIWKEIEGRIEAKQGGAELYFGAALVYGERGDAPSQRRCLELALEVNPEFGDAADQLARSYSEKEPTDLEKGLKAIELAIKSSPNHLGYRETRGRLLARLERWEEAEEELKLALRAKPNDMELHRLLISAYTAMEKPLLVTRHQRMLGQLERDAQRARLLEESRAER